MEQEEVLESLRLKKRKEYLRLMEVSDLTGQLAEAVDRRDEPSVKMLLAMRQEPLLALQEVEQSIHEDLLSVPQEMAIRLTELLDGAEAATAAEAGLCEQVQRNRRQLEKVCGLDRTISTKLGGKRSFYNNIGHPAMD